MHWNEKLKCLGIRASTMQPTYGNRGRIKEPQSSSVAITIDKQDQVTTHASNEARSAHGQRD